MPGWSLAELLCAALPGGLPAAEGDRGSVPLIHSSGCRVPDPTSFTSWAFLEANAAPTLCLAFPLPGWPRATLAHLLSPVGDLFSKTALVLSDDSSALSLQLWGFGSGTKLVEDFENLSGAAVPHHWLWPWGQPGCSLSLQWLGLSWGNPLLLRMGSSQHGGTTTRTKEIAAVCITINTNRSTVLVVALNFQLWQVVIKGPDTF